MVCGNASSIFSHSHHLVLIIAVVGRLPDKMRGVLKRSCGLLGGPQQYHYRAMCTVHEGAAARQLLLFSTYISVTLYS